MVVFFALLSVLAVAGIVATIVEMNYRGPRRVTNRYTGTR